MATYCQRHHQEEEYHSLCQQASQLTVQLIMPTYQADFRVLGSSSLPSRAKQVSQLTAQLIIAAELKNLQ